MNQLSSRFSHLPAHDHNLLLYESHVQQFKSVAPFVRDGIEAGDRCMYFVHDNTRDEVVTALKERGVAVDTALDSGQLTFHRASDIYLDNGTFDPDRMVDKLEGNHSAAVEAGPDRTRLIGEMTWAAEHDIDHDLLKAYERKVDEFYKSDSLIGLCQYRRSRFSSEFLDSMLRSHPQVLHDAEPRLNSFYEPSDVSEGTGDGTGTLDRKLKTISEQKLVSESLDERERCLSLLCQATDLLQEAEPDEIERIAGDIIGEIVEPSLITFHRYAKTSGRLQTHVLQNTLTGVDPEAVIDRLDERTWNVFVENEMQDFAVEDGPSVTGKIIPAGEHGVFLIGLTGAGGISETDLDFISAVVSHTEVALDQITYETRLEDKNERLREQNATLERVNKINAVIRQINRSLVDATTEEEVAKEVCKLLMEEACIDFAWFGSYDPVTRSVSPKQQAGDGRNYLDAITFDEDWAGNEPAARVARSRERTVVERVYDEPPLEQWQDLALKRDFRSAVSLPVSYDDSMYGVLAFYSDTPGTFDDEIVSVLDELSDCVAYAINSIDRKQALVSESVTELKIRISDIDLPAVEFVSENDCRMDIEELTSRSDGGLRVFITFYGISKDEIRSYAVASPAIDSIEILSEGANGYACECTVTDRSLTATMLNHNAVPQSLNVEDGEAHLVVQLPQDERVRGFMEMFQTKYPSTELVGRRNYDQSLRRISDIEGQLESELTDRQLEILKLAYHSGYFERPRQRSAEDIADILNVTPPTVSRHLREAERRVFSLFFENGEG